MIWKEFTDNLEKIYKCLDALNMEFIYLNMAMILPMIHDKETIIEKNENSIFFKVKWQQGCLIPLTEDKKLFFEDLFRYLKKEKELKHIPDLFAKNFSKIASITSFQKEHIIETKILVDMPWKILEWRRYEKNKFLKWKNWEFEIVELSKENQELFIECNRLWYKRQTEVWDKWRLSWKREIEWSIYNYQKMKDLWVNVKTIWFLQDWEIKCFVTGCQLTNKYWTCQTQRRSDLKYSWLWYFMWSKLWEYFSDFEFENDWTSDTKGIYASKYPFTKWIKTSYLVRLK